MKSTRFALVAPILLLAGFSALAADGARRDQDEARKAVERHDIRPLEEILARLRDQAPGEIVKVKLEHEHGAWRYEFRLVDREGRIREVAVDAASGAITNAGDD